MTGPGTVLGRAHHFQDAHEEVSVENRALVIKNVPMCACQCVPMDQEIYTAL